MPRRIVTATTPWDEMPAALTVREAAAVAGLTRQRAYELITLGKFPAWKISDRCIRVGRDQLRAHLGQLPAVEAPATETPAPLRRSA